MTRRELPRLFMAAAFAAWTAACAGATDTEVDDDPTIDDSESALSADPSTSSGGAASADDSGASANDGDDGGSCHHGDHDHKHHRKHKWKVLDGLDGAQDKVITIASLPADLSDHLLAKLHAIDTNSDGAVTRDEVKAYKHAKKSAKHEKKHDHDDKD